MTTDVYRFEFDDRATREEAELTLHLATYAVEGLFGAARVRMDAGYHVDEPHHAITIDGTTDVGAALVQVFTSLALREFGEEAFRVRRMPVPTAAEGRAA